MQMQLSACTAISFCLLLLSADPSHGSQKLKLKQIARGFARPVYVTAVPTDTNQVYVIEQWSGNIVEVNLDTGHKRLVYTVTGLSTGYSYGLIGMAFHPHFASNGKIYLSLTTGGDPPTSVIREYTKDGFGTLVQPRDLLVFQQPNREHNNGWIGFGPKDGLLYITTGDGGPGFGGVLKGGNSSQRLDTVFGKVLRIDVDRTDEGLPYHIPDGSNGEVPNPFIGHNGVPYQDSFGGVARPEVWAFGLRSPWRNSFDRVTGDFYIGDTGDSDWEWINFLPAKSLGGQNFRWCVMAGSHSVFGVNTEAPNQDELMAHCVAETSAGPLTMPIYEYPHAGASKAIIGGYVYQGCAIPWLRGTYFFADNTDSAIFSFRYDPQIGMTEFTDRTIELRPNQSEPPYVGIVTGPSSFGEDARGELYVISYDDGVLYRIESADAPQDCNGNGAPDSCEVGAPDLNGDGRIDLVDFAGLTHCLNGPCHNSGCTLTDDPPTCCTLGDIEPDGSVDLHDVAGFINLFRAN